ncbi:ABC transporter permease [Cellulomonas chengniuliangii]|uniref:ABC transporter permease n=1 Tax=Cellulomonas chengniuliangii TaxID=2968084 RepID=A0ABY5KV79_9CELL|nr:ABC transporter permease [Cellulomonas chengniuliangii]MCC2308900.1 ABC transporter permease [Cellulomonas chengniuliangii]MCC2319427.1 ABC transporter permease [Cellulomonas chengniuliangii]UUI74360.1 ABC transporter permease [Cellulomonas chengniuliangii]
MAWYIGRRLVQTIPVFLGATLLIFAMVFALPGDPVQALGGDRGLSPALAERIRENFNLDKPFLMQYLLYLKGVLTFDFGTTFSGRSVRDVIGEALPTTFKLAAMALVFEAVLGIAAGLVAGLRKGKAFDATVLVTSMLVIAVPTFVIGFVLQFVVGVQWGVLPPTVGSDVSVRTLLMPAMVLGAVSLAYVLRLTRTSVAENLTADYVRTATAKGLSRPRVVTVHVLRNSLIPVVTFLGADLGALMGGAIITEGIFNINGVGGTLFRAIQQGQASTVVSLTTVLVVIYIAANLVVDVLYAALDPRIRYA